MSLWLPEAWPSRAVSLGPFIIISFIVSIQDIPHLLALLLSLQHLRAVRRQNRSVPCCGYSLPQSTLFISIFLHILHLANGWEGGRQELACDCNSNRAWVLCRVLFTTGIMIRRGTGRRGR